MSLKESSDTRCNPEPADGNTAPPAAPSVSDFVEAPAKAGDYTRSGLPEKRMQEIDDELSKADPAAEFSTSARLDDAVGAGFNPKAQALIWRTDPNREGEVLAVKLEGPERLGGGVVLTRQMVKQFASWLSRVGFWNREVGSQAEGAETVTLVETSAADRPMMDPEDDFSLTRTEGERIVPDPRPAAAEVPTTTAAVDNSGPKETEKPEGQAQAADPAPSSQSDTEEVDRTRATLFRLWGNMEGKTWGEPGNEMAQTAHRFGEMLDRRKAQARLHSSRAMRSRASSVKGEPGLRAFLLKAADELGPPLPTIAGMMDAASYVHTIDDGEQPDTSREEVRRREDQICKATPALHIRANVSECFDASWDADNREVETDTLRLSAGIACEYERVRGGETEGPVYLILNGSHLTRPMVLRLLEWLGRIGFFTAETGRDCKVGPMVVEDFSEFEADNDRDDEENLAEILKALGVQATTGGADVSEEDRERARKSIQTMLDEIRGLEPSRPVAEIISLLSTKQEGSHQ